MDRLQVKLLEFVKKQDYFLKALVSIWRLRFRCAHKKHLQMVNFSVISKLMKDPPKPERGRMEGKQSKRDKARLWVPKG